MSPRTDTRFQVAAVQVEAGAGVQGGQQQDPRCQQLRHAGAHRLPSQGNGRVPHTRQGQDRFQVHGVLREGHRPNAIGRGGHGRMGGLAIGELRESRVVVPFPHFLAAERTETAKEQAGRDPAESPGPPTGTSLELCCVHALGPSLPA